MRKPCRITQTGGNSTVALSAPKAAVGQVLQDREAIAEFPDQARPAFRFG